MKIGIENYTFNATGKTISFNDLTSVNLNSLLIIDNTTRGTLIFNFADSTKVGTVSGNTLTLGYDTSSMNNNDKLLIYYEDFSLPTELPYNGVYSSPVDFTAAYASSSSITITGATFTVDDTSCYVSHINYKPSGGRWR